MGLEEVRGERPQSEPMGGLGQPAELDPQRVDGRFEAQHALQGPGTGQGQTRGGLLVESVTGEGQEIEDLQGLLGEPGLEQALAAGQAGIETLLSSPTRPLAVEGQGLAGARRARAQPFPAAGLAGHLADEEHGHEVPRLQGRARRLGQGVGLLLALQLLREHQPGAGGVHQMTQPLQGRRPQPQREPPGLGVVHAEGVGRVQVAQGLLAAIEGGQGARAEVQPLLALRLALGGVLGVEGREQEARRLVLALLDLAVGQVQPGALGELGGVLELEVLGELGGGPAVLLHAHEELAQLQPRRGGLGGVAELIQQGLEVAPRRRGVPAGQLGPRLGQPHRGHRGVVGEVAGQAQVAQQGLLAELVRPGGGGGRGRQAQLVPADLSDESGGEQGVEEGLPEAPVVELDGHRAVRGHVLQAGEGELHGQSQLAHELAQGEVPRDQGAPGLPVHPLDLDLGDGLLRRGRAGAREQQADRQGPHRASSSSRSASSRNDSASR